MGLETRECRLILQGEKCSHCSVPLKFPIYLDHHATTPVDPRVLKAMIPYLAEHFGNPSSASHAFGWQAEAAVELARGQVARLIHAKDPKEVIWTSGTTEANNWSLLGIARSYREKGNHLITSMIEHRSVLDVAKQLEKEGIQVTYLPVDRHGLVDPDDVRKAITPKTILISLMAANNEIGTIEPIREVGKMAKEKEILFHVDAAQGCGKVLIDVEAMGIDLLSMSAHKIYGPKGIGALYLRDRNPHVRLAPLLHGGGQERGLRPGTLAVPNIVGMGKAFEIAAAEMEKENQRIGQLRDRLEKTLLAIERVTFNGHPTQRLSGNLNVSFGIPSADFIAKIPKIAVSSGSACASGSAEPSYVIQALGVGEERAKTSIRFGLGRFNTAEEIDYAIEAILSFFKSLIF